MRLVTTFMLAGLLSACGSSPTTQYYVLKALAEPALQKTAVKENFAPSIGVGPVKIAGYLERPELVASGGGFQLQNQVSQRWAEPVDTAITRVVSDNLARLTAAQQVHSFPWRRDSQPQLVLRLQVLSLDINASAEAELRVVWQLAENAAGATIASGVDSFTQPAGLGAAQQAEAYSQLLLQLSHAVASAISRWQPPQ
jgi:hypothetical protein